MNRDKLKLWKDRFRETALKVRERTARAWAESEWPARAHTSIREKLNRWQVREKLVRLLPQDLAKTFPRHLEPLAVAEWTGQAFQRQGAGFYGKLLTIFLCAYFLADVTAILIGSYIPQPPAARLSRFGGFSTPYQKAKAPTLDDYQIIFSRNLFNSQGLIPGEEAPQGPGGPAVRTALPFNLIGTVILQDELRSIATIEDKTATTVYPVRVNDEIPSKARIIGIEPRKVTFINLSNGRKEFVDLPEDVQTGNPRVTVGKSAHPETGGGVEQVSPTQFSISRAEVDRTLSDFNNVLTQARAVPNFENGLPAGYKLFQIVPGSIYSKLGLKDGDIICGLNGQSINDPGKAFELLGELKTSSHLELCVKRDGRQATNSYDIH